ncbi:MAG TPA: RsmE family RNA methyltransferase [Candidatus Acidoferrales bacterium]|nr:RsmE family RNA methyltransferase [Candidatus Acidoferrales bacterium]
MSTPQFIVSPEALSGSRATLTGQELHHLRVRRLRAGSEVVLCDARGSQRHGVVLSIDRHCATIGLSSTPAQQRESPLQLVLAQALLKADKLDLIIEKATELGVSGVVLFSSERSAGRVTADRQARWNRIARGATKQCQRSTAPSVAGPISFDELLSQHTAAQRLFFWEDAPPGGLAAAHAECPRTAWALVVVGPEGGFSAAEAQRAAAAGFRLIGLGPRILRAETAAVIAVALTQFLWGDMADGAPRISETA